jgi:hypothetical protein
VWYLNQRIPPAASSEPSRLSHLISQLNRSTNPDSIDLKQTNPSFGVELTGTLETNIEFELGSNHQETIRTWTEMQRKLIVNSLNDLLVTLQPPLYLGRAENLQARLSQHIEGLRRLGQGETYPDMDIEGKEFAERATQRGIRLPDLRFRCFEFDYTDFTEQFAFEAIKIVEFVMNRTLRPILGKR